LSETARDLIQNITVQSAKDGLDLYERYRLLYSNRQQPHLLAFCLVHLADVMVRHGEKNFDNDVINFCLETLAEASPGFAFVGTLQAMFCETVLACSLTLPPPAVLSELMGWRSWNSFSREDKLDCCERLTYAQPLDLLTERLDPNLASDFEQEWRAFSEAQGDQMVHSSGVSRPSAGVFDDQKSASESSGSRSIRIQRLMNP
jgi:hypothetical protein